MRVPFLTLRSVAAIAGVLTLAACEAANDPAVNATGGTAFSLLPTGISNQPDGAANNEQFEVCKIGSDGSFSASAEDFNNSGAITNATFNVTKGTCVLAAAFDRYGADVTVEETGVPAGYQFDSVKVTVVGVGAKTYVQYTPKVEEMVAGQLGGSRGVLAVYYNSQIPTGGGEGCTPGYWKQSQHFDSYPAGYDPYDLFDTYFDNAFPGKTLLGVLQLGGGGLNALGRHTVAALLNSASTGVDYDLTNSGVISAFNAAFASGNYETQKDIFAGFNEQGCPLN